MLQAAHDDVARPVAAIPGEDANAMTRPEVVGTHRGRLPYWTTDPGLARVTDALEQAHGRVRIAAKAAGCGVVTMRRCIRILRQRRVKFRDNTGWSRRKTFDANATQVINIHSKMIYAQNREQRILAGNAQEIDASACPLAQAYKWPGRCYGSEADHVSVAGPELSK